MLIIYEDYNPKKKKKKKINAPQTSWQFEE